MAIGVVIRVGLRPDRGSSPGRDSGCKPMWSKWPSEAPACEQASNTFLAHTSSLDDDTVLFPHHHLLLIVTARRAGISSSPQKASTFLIRERVVRTYRRVATRCSIYRVARFVMRLMPCSRFSCRSPKTTTLIKLLWGQPQNGTDNRQLTSVKGQNTDSSFCDRAKKFATKVGYEYVHAVQFALLLSASCWPVVTKCGLQTAGLTAQGNSSE